MTSSAKQSLAPYGVTRPQVRYLQTKGYGMHVQTLTIEPGAPELETAPRCDCGEVLSPAGECFNVGFCIAADSSATKGAARQTAKYAVPAAWNARGYVD